MLPIPEKALDYHIGILGKTGSGKSNTAKVIAESIMAAGGRVCVIDPTGTWWGMRLSADGRKPSKFSPVIFGGNHADIPITGDHGAAIAQAIGTSSTSAIIDTRLLSVGARTRFFTAFAETLLSQNNGPLTLIIDEAHLFAPQGRVNDPQSGAMVHAANNLVSLGRGIGLRIILISQRPAKLHKDSLTQVETLVAMRLIAPQDRGAIDDWIGEWAGKEQGKEIMGSLASMPTGEAWVWSPELQWLQRAKFPLAATFDSGRPSGAQQALSPLDVSAITSKLETIRQDVVANDPVRLKRQVAELQKQLAAAPTVAAIDPAVVQEAENRGYVRGYETCRRDQHASSFRSGFHDATQKILASANLMAKLEPDDILVPALPAETVTRTKPPEASAPKTEVSNAPPTKPPVKMVDHIQQPGDFSITPAKRRILGALRDLEAIGQTAPDKLNLAWFADASPKSSSYSNNLGALRSAGLIEYPGQGTVGLTDAGRAAEPARGAPTHAHIMALVASKLVPAVRRMLDAAVAAYPDSLSIDALAAQIEQSSKSSSFSNNRGRLRSLGLIDYPSAGTVRAADLLFPEGKN